MCVNLCIKIYMNQFINLLKEKCLCKLNGQMMSIVIEISESQRYNKMFKNEEVLV